MYTFSHEFSKYKMKTIKEDESLFFCIFVVKTERVQIMNH